MNVIIKPVVTEKSMNNVGQNKYTFIVDRKAKKKVIKKAVEKLFNVHVTSVMTTVVKGKTVRTGAKRIEKKLTPVKKAMIEIKSGEKIGIFEQSK